MPKVFDEIWKLFFCRVDQDGNGEIEQGEASKFLRKLDAQMADDGEMETKEGMSELMASSQFDFTFSYGGNTISAEEMLDHLSNMMTANHVVDWVTHGLELPQYAEAFRQNAINGMDFPALIEDDGVALLEDLGIKSTLHRTKITHALVRQIFGIGTVPGPVRSLQCNPSSYGGIELSWEAPTNRGVPPLHKHLIERWSKTFSTWTSVNDTREVVFLDRNAIRTGKDYTYRVQSWGNHGPSNWVTVDGCRADFTSLSPSKLDIEDNLPLQMFEQVNAKLDSELLMPIRSKSSQEEESSLRPVINYVILMLLGFISRHAFFFDVTSAAWILLKNHLWQAVTEGEHSPYLFVSTAARSIKMAFDSWSYMRHKVWMLSRLGVDTSLDSTRGVSTSSFEAEREVNGAYSEAEAIRSNSSDNLHEASDLGLQTSSKYPNGISPNNSERETELQYSTQNAASFSVASPPQDAELPNPSRRSKNRCSHECCKVRFDRWRSLQDWWMKFNKHYCGQCQSVYCVKHTRISPHGPRGQCGLESHCYCYSCFASLPKDVQRRLEEHNKLRAGPTVTSNLSSLASSSKPRSDCSFNGSAAGDGLPPPLSDTMGDYLDGNGLLDFRDMGVSKAAFDSGLPDDSSEQGNSKRKHRKQRSFA